MKIISKFLESSEKHIQQINSRKQSRKQIKSSFAYNVTEVTPCNGQFSRTW